jgi:hypothetical protein
MHTRSFHRIKGYHSAKEDVSLRAGLAVCSGIWCDREKFHITAGLLFGAASLGMSGEMLNYFLVLGWEAYSKHSCTPPPSILHQTGYLINRRGWKISKAYCIWNKNCFFHATSVDFSCFERHIISSNPPLPVFHWSLVLSRHIISFLGLVRLGADSPNQLGQTTKANFVEVSCLWCYPRCNQHSRL